MRALHWFEAKQLDRVTNYSTETEIIEFGLKNDIKTYYYCSFAKKKKYYGLKGNIKYLGVLQNKYLKAIEFRLLVIIKAISIVLSEKGSVIMVNQNLILHMTPAVLLNKLLRQNNKFITDIRTTPTNPNNFDADMNAFHSQFKHAIKNFDGYSFITPFMEKYIMDNYKKETYKSVNWSSGVDIELFNPGNFSRQKSNNILTLFYHGGISVSRGNLDLIKAVELLIKEGYNIELIQIGIVVDQAIKDYISSNNLTSWCKLLPPVPLSEIPQMIADSDLPVLPFPNFMAWRVSSPIKLMEYLAMGKKVLAPNMESFTDVFGKKSDLVFYFESKDINQIDAMAKAIQNIVDDKLLKDGNFYDEARTFVSKNYTWKKQASNLFTFCETL